MRKSLREIQQIEAYLQGSLEEQQVKDFQIQLLLDPELQKKVALQEEVYAQIRWFGRKKLKAELQNLHQALYHTPDRKPFWQKIMNIFT